MNKHLYFICPDDHLESVINNTFKQENYFLTSPGNSITFDLETLSDVNELLQAKGIGDISFVLSQDNRFVSDGLGKKEFSAITGLNTFYQRITSEKERNEPTWQTSNHHFLILSHYLNSKMRELKLGLEGLMVEQIQINGQIYKRQEEAFTDIYSDLICRKFFSLN